MKYLHDVLVWIFSCFSRATIVQGWADGADVFLVAWRSYQVLLQAYPLEGGSCMGGEDCSRRHHLFQKYTALCIQMHVGASEYCNSIAYI